jgi:hypothetical protein
MFGVGNPAPDCLPHPVIIHRGVSPASTIRVSPHFANATLGDHPKPAIEDRLKTGQEE